MATNPTSQVIQRLRRVLLRDDSGLTDGQLLRCFIDGRDEAAFAALVKRHGPLVWNVCRRLLAEHDAEDAFQATFLVLCRKAATIRSREMVAGWLYGVAHQTALQARRTAARRRAREKQVVDMPEPAVVEAGPWDDLQPLLDQELSRLHDSHRVVIVLCDLEGKTRKEAARLLGLAEGTVASRLARARAMLAKRLARHGLGISGGALAAVLAEKAMAAPVPASLEAFTIKAIPLIATGRAAADGVLSGTAAALTKGVMTAMLLEKLMRLMGVLLVIAALAGGAELIYRMQAAEATERHQGNKRPRARAGAADRGKRPKDDPITPEARKAIETGLKLLADGQNEDGSFGKGAYKGNVGVTSLAALALVAGGHEADASPRGKVVCRALDFVLAQENRQGRFPGFLHNPAASPHGPMYSHGFATLFLASLHGKVKDKKQAEKVTEALDRAVKLIVNSQNKEGGWRYMPTSMDADSTVTACVMMALAAARQAGVKVPKKTTAAGVGYLKKCFRPETGGFDYMARGGGKPTFARTAAAVAVLQAMGIDKGDEVEKGLALVVKDRPAPAVRPDMHYYYGHYYAVRALHGRGGKGWRDWYAAVRKDLLERQDRNGGWQDQIDLHYSTAMACLVLLAPDGRLAVKVREPGK
jgi:RNA polymerase sigma factor (sigma-70 family)